MGLLFLSPTVSLLRPKTVMSRLLKISSRSTFNPGHEQSTQLFNQESGQVYTETISSGGPMTADWVWKTIGSPTDARNFRFCGPGCASLSNMAIRTAVANNISITSETLAEVPWSIGKLLWRRIVDS